MKKLLLLIVILLLAGWAGWLTFSRSDGRASFTIETGEIADDAQRALQQGEDLTRDMLNPDEVDSTGSPEPAPAPVEESPETVPVATGSERSS